MLGIGRDRGDLHELLEPGFDAIALGLSGPIFLTVLSIPFLGERVGPRRWSACIVGFVGVLIMTRPSMLFMGAGVWQAEALVPLLAAVFYALAMISIRKLTATEGSGTIVFYFSLFATLFGLSALPAVAADGYPARPVRLVVPFGAGGGSDFIARALADKLGQELGASIVVENRPGAGGTLGTALVAQAAPDGYTFLFTSASYTYQPSLYKNLPYQPLRDFKNVTNFASAPVVTTT